MQCSAAQKIKVARAGRKEGWGGEPPVGLELEWEILEAQGDELGRYLGRETRDPIERNKRK